MFLYLLLHPRFDTYLLKSIKLNDFLYFIMNFFYSYTNFIINFKSLMDIQMQ